MVRIAGRALVVVLAIVGMVLGTGGAYAATSQGVVVAATPSSTTPDVLDGTVYAIASAGGRVFLGGDFTSVRSRGASSAESRSFLVSFDPATGVLDAGFAPQLDGSVSAIIEGPSNSIYVAGQFKRVNGKAMRVVRLDATTGAIMGSWKPSVFSAVTTTLALSGDVLYVGGTFAKVGGVAHAGLAALDPVTGKVLPWFNVNTAGRHGKGKAIGGKGAKTIKVNPAGTQMVVVGNFTSVTDAQGTVDRDQVFRVNLAGESASVDRTWRTLKFTAQCYNWAFDSTVRDVDFAPDGSYFVIVSTGGGGGGGNTDGSKSLCDAAARFESAGSGTNVAPTWVNYSGGDSLWSVAVTGTAVYAGGHQRWANNTYGVDTAGAGAVPRPGLSAFDPATGIPLSWNPGRNPRGAGAFALLATPDGLYVGSDTSWIGNYQWRRERIAYFPLAGGTAVPAVEPATVPGTIHLVGMLSSSTDALLARTLDAGGAVGATQVEDSSIPWSQARGAFLAGSTLYYGWSDGTFRSRAYDGGALGDPVTIDPYNDPVWSSVPTGSGSSMYRGRVPDLYGSKLATVTSMFYVDGRLYYTLSDSPQMRWRSFLPESSIMGADEHVVADGINWSKVAGAFVAGDSLYYALRTDGVLRKFAWTGTMATGAATIVDSTNNWAAHGMFVTPAPPANEAPSAAFAFSCVELVCSFDGSGSSDPDGSITRYDWDFGDAAGSGVSVSHGFAEPGTYAVSLTVTDDRGGTGVVTQQVTVEQGAEPVSEVGFVGSSGANANVPSPSVGVPAGVAAGDTLLLMASVDGSPAVVDPPGWTRVESASTTALVSYVWTRTATAADAGSVVTVPLGSRQKSALVVAAYRGAAVSGVAASAVVDAGTATHTAGSVTVPAGSWVVWFWAERSPTTTAWVAGPGVQVREAVFSTGAGRVSALVGDTGAARTGVVAGAEATADSTSKQGITWSIVVPPAT